MNVYLLDTDICIFLLKGKYGIIEKIKEVGPDNCAISEITIGELSFGAFKSANPEKHIKDVAQIEDLFDVIPIYESLEIFGKEKARLNKSGNGIPDFDLLIGVTAVQRGMIMVTNNEKHLSRIEGIRLENWIKSGPDKM